MSMRGIIFSMDQREEIKNKIDIADLVQGYIPLKKSGRNFKACCPFHGEKTASFMVSSEKQIWHCFGCNEGGDIFGFVMKMEGLDFYSALKLLAEKAGVKLERENNNYAQIRDKKDKFFEINKIACEYYEKLLFQKEGEEALKYLKKRGLLEKTIREFRLGLAPAKSTLIMDLKKVGFSENELLEAGVAKRREGKVMDYFWKRLMFPICDTAGSVIGFSARTLDDIHPSTDSGSFGPKYLNTAETEIYHKSNVLYGMEKAKQEIRRLDHAIIVEGNMDVIMSHQAGVVNVVAASGTAFTENQLNIIKRFSKNIKLSFDVDMAGSEATKRAIELAMSEGFNVKVIEIPEGKDPADAVKKDKNLWINSCKNAKYVIDYLFDKAFLKHNAKEVLGKKEIARELLGVIKKLPDDIEQDHYIKELGQKLKVGEESLKSALKKTKIEKPKEKKEEIAEAKKNSTEEHLIGRLLVAPEYRNYFLRKLGVDDFTKENTKSLFRLIEKQKDLNRINDDEAKLLQMKAELELDGFTPEQIGEDIFFLVDRLKKDKLQKEGKRIEIELIEAEKQGDKKKRDILINKLSMIIKKGAEL